MRNKKFAFGKFLRDKKSAFLTDDGRATLWQAVAVRGKEGTTVHIQYNELSGLEMYLNHAQIELSATASVIRYPGNREFLTDPLKTVCAHQMFITKSLLCTIDLSIRTSNTSAVEVILSDGAAVEVKRLSKHLDLIIYLPDAVKGMFIHLCSTLLFNYVLYHLEIWGKSFSLRVTVPRNYLKQLRTKFTVLTGLSRGLFGSWFANESKDLYSPAERVYLCNSSAETLFEFGNHCTYEIEHATLQTF